MHRRLLASAAAAVVLTGCFGGSDDPPRATSSSSPSSPVPGTSASSLDPDTALALQFPKLGSADGTGLQEGLHVDLLAVERLSPDFVVARLLLARQTQDASVFSLIGRGSYVGQGFGGVRLVDAAERVVSAPLENAEGECVCAELSVGGSYPIGAPVPVWAVFALPAAHSAVSVQVDGFPTFAPVPVAERSGKAFSNEAGVEDATAAKPRTRALVVRTADLDDSSRTSSKGRSVTVDVSSDVLFAFGKAELTAPAKARLDRVAAQLRESAEGTVDIVGHTDSVGGDADNQTLSERRAAAVKMALDARLGDTSLRLTAAGKGEREPVAPERGPDAAQAAALNRRVTISYAVTKKAPPPTPSAIPSPPPPAPGAPVGTLTSTKRPMRLELVALRRIDEYTVVGEFRLTNTGTSTLILNSDLAERPLTDASGPMFEGPRLVDRAGGTAYKVLRDSETDCLCSRVEPIKAGATRPLFAAFAAPPAGVTAVDVTVPLFPGAMRNVPLT